MKLLRVAKRALVSTLILYASWMGMLLVHELGHVLHALVSGGRVAAIKMPLFGFSQTLVQLNPHELLVAAGGPVWGILIPLAATGVFRLMKVGVPDWLKFFAGFCLIANGTYIGVGWTMRAGDAHDLSRLGASKWLLTSIGAIALVGGLMIWHQCAWLSKAARPAHFPHFDPRKPRQVG